MITTAVKQHGTRQHGFVSDKGGKRVGWDSWGPLRRLIASRFFWLPAAGFAVVVVVLLLWWRTPLSRGSAAPTREYRVTATYPHAREAYCQGLVFHDGFLYEGTGGYGESVVRKTRLKSGEVLQEFQLPERFFGEGITIWQDRIIQLTWKSRAAFVYDLETLRPVGRFNYRGEGWGLTHDGSQLIMSDGSSRLRFLDPDTFRVQRVLTVRDGRRRVSNLNELEYIEGEIYANIWYDDRIARISPESGRVIEWIDLSKLYPRRERPHRDAVLNGIAYDAENGRLLVTGKNWPKLFAIKISP